jgi:hypothetical protein
MHAQLPNRTKMRQVMRYNSPNLDLDEDMLSVRRILNFSWGGDAEGNCWFCHLDSERIGRLCRLLFVYLP